MKKGFLRFITVGLIASMVIAITPVQSKAGGFGFSNIEGRSKNTLEENKLEDYITSGFRNQDFSLAYILPALNWAVKNGVFTKEQLHEMYVKEQTENRNKQLEFLHSTYYIPKDKINKVFSKVQKEQSWYEPVNSEELYDLMKYEMKHNKKFVKEHLKEYMEEAKKTAFKSDAYKNKYLKKYIIRRHTYNSNLINKYIYQLPDDYKVETIGESIPEKTDDGYDFSNFERITTNITDISIDEEAPGALTGLYLKYVDNPVNYSIFDKEKDGTVKSNCDSFDKDFQGKSFFYAINCNINPVVEKPFVMLCKRNEKTGKVQWKGKYLDVDKHGLNYYNKYFKLFDKANKSNIAKIFNDFKGDKNF